MNAAHTERVLVTGASGFIAQHCILELLRAGYHVVGTLRDCQKADGVRRTLGVAGELGSRLKFVEADLNRDAGWREIASGCRYVLHVASPLPRAFVADELSLVNPARQGTLRVLSAAAEAGVQRVVLTSSLSAIIFARNNDSRRALSEADWSDESQLGAYDKSKTLAERAAWDYVARLPQGKRLELVSINPGLVLGPVLSRDTSASAEVVRKLMAGEVLACPRVGWAPVDVRDVASAHVSAMLAPAAGGRRFACALGHTWMSDIARVLSRHFSARGYRIPTRTLPDWGVKALARFDGSMRLISGKLGRIVNVSTSTIRDELSWTPRPLEESIVAMGESLIAHGVV